MIKNTTVQYKKVNSGVIVNDPVKATTEAAAFDLSVPNFKSGTVLTVYPKKGSVENRKVQHDTITLNGGDTVIIPTNIAFNIPVEFDMLVFVRSSVGIKKGLALANSVAVIDSDYTDQLYIALTNTRDNVVQITTGERIVQCKLVDKVVSELTLVDTDTVFTKNSNRVGGIGSTNTVNAAEVVPTTVANNTVEVSDIVKPKRTAKTIEKEQVQ